MEPTPGSRPGAGARAARNAFVRGAAELLGKFASLALMAVLARQEGPAGLGVLVFALAWCDVATTPIDMGFDRWFLRVVARDHSALDSTFFNVLRLKLVRALPVIPLSWVLLWLLGHDGDAFLVVCIVTFSFLLDSLSYTVFSAFNGVERGDLVGLALAVQRLVAAGAGIALLLAGFGVVAVACAYVAGALVGFGVALILLARKVGMPKRATPAAPRADLVRRSRPFAGQELLSIGLAKVDVLLISALTSAAVVGYYGASYRLLEATLFIPTALQGAFAAMYTYLDERSDPTIRDVFQRSIKLVLVLLVPCAVPLALIPGPLLSLFFGSEFEAATGALRALAPTVVLLGIVLLSMSLMSSRLDPRRLILFYGIALVVNVGANLALVPPLGATGAGLAMLATELVLAVLAMSACLREVGGLDLGATVGGTVVAATAMAGVVFALDDLLFPALVAGGIVYLGVLAAVERITAPADFDYVAQAIRKRLSTRVAHAAPD